MKDVIPAGNVANISGDGGTGKSVIGMMLGASAAARKPWFGIEVMPGPAIFFAAEEDKAELHRRLEDIREHMDIGYTELCDLHLMCMFGRETVLAEFDRGIIRPTPTFAALEEFVLDVKPVAVTIDTTADVFGGSEIDRREVRQFIGLLRGLSLKANTTILTLSHPSLSGMSSGSGTSGSTGWSNNVRSRLYFMHSSEKDEATGEVLDPDARVLSLKKSNYGPPGFSIKLRWSKGVFVVDEQASSRAIFDEVIFLQLLDAYSAEERQVSPHRSVNYAPTLFSRDPRAQKTTKKAFEVAMTNMIDRGEIVVEPFGPPSHRRHRIVRG